MAQEIDEIENSDDEWFDSMTELDQWKRGQIEYYQSHGLASLYLIARMNWKGRVNARNSYTASEGKPLTVRELEKLQVRYPAKLTGKQSRRTISKKRVVEDDQTGDLVTQLVKTIEAIDWESIQDDQKSMDLLRSVGLRLNYVAELVDKWQ